MPSREFVAGVPSPAFATVGFQLVFDSLCRISDLLDVFFRGFPCPPKLCSRAAKNPTG